MMHNFSAFHHSEWTLKRKLFGYMLLLAALPLFALMAGLFLFGRFGNTEKSIRESLDIQMEVFEKDVFTHFDYLAAAGIQLSEDMTSLLEQYLDVHELNFEDMTDSGEHIAGIQEEMVEPLKNKLLQEDCSGIFVMFDATVNSALEHADFSRTGLYLQVNGYEVNNPSLLLYRGLADVGKTHGIMPHRKWRLEFQTNQFPEFEESRALTQSSRNEMYRYTGLFTLPGTSENAILLTVPMVGTSGEFYGLCGFEISASYFMTYHAQPTKIEHLTCLLAPARESLSEEPSPTDASLFETMVAKSFSSNSPVIDASAGLSCGVAGGYYRTPKGELTVKATGDSMFCFSGESGPYIGVQRSISLSPNNEDYTLTAMMLKSDYDRAVRKSLLQNAILWSLLLFFIVRSCLYFSKRFLSPVLSGLEQIRLSQWKEAQSEIPEINDLFAFLAEKDREHEDALHVLSQEKMSIQSERNLLLGEYEQALSESRNIREQLELAQSRYEQAQNQYEQAQSRYEEAQNQVQNAQTEISRLAYSRKTEIDPDAYAQFLGGINSLTPAEHRIFEHYLEGRTVKEIMEIASIKESTLRYHNQNIYGKLGVNSLKQLLRYAALMRQEGAGE